MVSSDYRPFTDITSTLGNDLSSLSPALSNRDFESDITDLHATLPRSPSRLGFNLAKDGGGFCEMTGAEEKQARLKWTCSLFQSTSQNGSDFCEQASLSGDLASCSSSLSELGDDSESSSDDSDEDDSPPRLIPFRRPPLQRSTRSSNLQHANGQPVRPASPPSLLSVPSPPPQHQSGNQTPPASPQINHHGLSRSALMHQKWFWSTRYEEWAIWEAQMEEAESISHAYGGMALLPGTCPALSRGRWSSSLEAPPPSPCPSPVSPRIFPRLGDISALRDPYSVDIDRCFCHFPLWTVHKTLYMFDMHHRSTSPERTTPKLTVDHSDFISNRAATVTTGQGDKVSGYTECNVTLVSGDFSDGSITNQKYLEADDDTHKSEEDDNVFHTWDGVRAWEMSWYARWELLIELVKNDESKRNALEYVGTSSREPPPMFFFAGENGEEDDDDDDDDDEEDYGTIISNPVFGRRVQTGLGKVQKFFANDDKNDLCLRTRVVES
ncbi:hypothetical protein PILCRDRAFT_816036 [Piloderma croceum F 1598]|uniref:Uncharacterized protein n=1 Tax=Piloderma croceum (strain F 1598) TaxID=765440 RepID=A0A0C3BK82_PILCF|nr:hypothetical protein PILCRDRAFT_816036 [Piloderma croceum F 1598]